MNPSTPNLDATTLFFVVSVMAFLFASISLSTLLKLKQKLYGHLDMTIALGYLFIAFILFFFTRSIPYKSTFLLANFAALQFIPYSISAFGKILHEKTPNTLLRWVTLLGLLGVASRCAFDTSHALALISMSTAIAIQCVVLFKIVAKRFRKAPSTLTFMHSLLLTICIVLMTSRALRAIFGDYRDVLPASQSTQQIATLISITITTLITFFCFQELVSEKIRVNFGEKLRRDGLTGLYMRTAFIEMRPAIEVRSNSEEFAILMIDIDHFKSINDTFGHSAGDTVLAHVGRLISASCRLSDIAVRYGGDEFLLLIWNCSPVEAKRLSEDLVWQARNSCVRLSDSKNTSFTLSIGYASRTNDGARKVLDKAIDQADLALYEAKGAGRNQAFGQLMQYR